MGSGICVCSVDSWQLRAECLLEIQLSVKELPFPKSHSFPKGSPHIELYGCKGTKMSSYLSSMWGIYAGLSQLQTSLWQRSLLWLLKFNIAQSAFFTGVTTESFYQETFSIQICVCHRVFPGELNPRQMHTGYTRELFNNTRPQPQTFWFNWSRGKLKYFKHSPDNSNVHNLNPLSLVMKHMVWPYPLGK